MIGAIDAIADHLRDGSMDDGLVFDAVRIRLVEIGEAVKAVDAALLALEPTIPWSDVAGMRDVVVHRYFDTAHAVMRATIEDDLPPLRSAAVRLLSRLDVAAPDL
jgi:uncharacterized protein with HEPN domain